MKKVWEDTAWNDYLYWQEHDKTKIKNWGQALNQFAIEFGNERVPFL